jgi:hypothetical protein
VAEVSDQAGPRVHPDRPNLYVGVTIEDPERKFDRLRQGVRPQHPVGQHGARLRSDLYEHLPAYSDLAAATATKKELVHSLRREGFAVNGVRHRYRVYVIRLRDEVGPRRSADRPWIYVGQTSKDVKARFVEHIDGARTPKGRRLYSGVVHRYGVELIPELYEAIPEVYTLEEARQLEKNVAEDLVRQGYSVRGGH